MEVGDIFTTAMTFVIVGIGVAYGLTVLESSKDSLATCSTGRTYNASADKCYNDTNTPDTVDPVNEAYVSQTNTIDGVDNFPEKLPLLATILIAALIIGILIQYMGAR